MPLIDVQNVADLARYEFSGSALPTDWNIVQQGTGMSVSVASSLMTIASGTTASAQTIVRCTQAIRPKFYVRFVASLSQRIANQNIYLEITNGAGTTFARYDFNGTTATSGQCQTGNAGTNNTAVTVTIPTTASYGTFDIYADSHDVVFSSVASNTNAAKSGIAAFDRLVLDPNEDYYVQVRVLNGGTAPASTTSVNIDAVVIRDLTGVYVDVVRGDGTAALSNATPVQVLSAPTTAVSQSGTWTVQPGNTANTTPWLTANYDNVFYNESTTAQAASATLTGTSRDTGVAAAAVHRYGAFNAVAFADQAGTLRIEMSNDSTPLSWRRATADTAVTANAVVTLSVPVVTRYYRAVYVNGATPQNAFMLNTGFTAA